MAEHVLTGLPAAPGTAAGRARRLDDPGHDAPPGLPGAELARARGALAAAADELDALAGRLRADGRSEEADIVATGALMAADPALDAAVERLTAAGRPAAAAVRDACAEHAAALAGLDDPHLAARAEDVRSLGRRAARLAAGGRGEAARDTDEPVVLVGEDLGPADVAELGSSVAGVVLVAGTPTGHAAVVARGLGIPMVVGLGAALADARDGAPLVVDGAAGSVVLHPCAERLDAALDARRRHEAERARAVADRGLPAVTRDGVAVRVLVNAATVPELEAGLAAGAEGVGLLRTELAFLDARAWPDERAHRAALAPVLRRLRGRTATVRVLDFGGDKSPPFLDGAQERGVALLLAAPEALAAQLRAIAAEGEGTDLRVLLPLAEQPAEIETVRRLLAGAAAVGAMVETVSAAYAADALAAAADFLSIGTNDLAHAAAGSDRFLTGSAPPAHDPRVLRLVARTADAARRAGVPLEVCGDAASDPVAVPLLVGLGVDELSVGAARVGRVRAWIRALDHAAAADAARAALSLPDAGAVEALLRERGLVPELGDAAGERGDGRAGVVAVGPQV
jgi:multiphosphoryl transfer protein